MIRSAIIHLPYYACHNTLAQPCLCSDSLSAWRLDMSFLFSMARYAIRWVTTLHSAETLERAECLAYSHNLVYMMMLTRSCLHYHDGDLELRRSPISLTSKNETDVNVQIVTIIPYIIIYIQRMRERHRAAPSPQDSCHRMHERVYFKSGYVHHS